MLTLEQKYLHYTLDPEIYIVIYATFLKVKSESEFRAKDVGENRNKSQTVVLRWMPQILIYLHAICAQSKHPRTISRST
jgi:uncharacterized protein (DUF1499 family)